MKFDYFDGMVNGMRIYNGISELVGRTPMLALNRIKKEQGFSASIIAKLEYFNPAGSVKDRVAKAMIDDAEKKGFLKQGSVIVESTSGNTGIGLASIGAERGYRVILTMSETMSVERRNLLKAYGAELVLTEAAKGMSGAVEKAEQIAAETPNSFVPRQFDNFANPAIHKATTVNEIWEDTDGKIDIFVSAVGTGGTISGVGGALKEKNPGIRVVAVEPYGSQVLGKGTPGPHNIQGIGPGFIPGILDTSVYDEIIPVKEAAAFEMGRACARTEGVLVGISSGAALWAAIQVAHRPENAEKNIVVVFPDTGERYLSTEMFSY